jgi:hypothetical protein
MQQMVINRYQINIAAKNSNVGPSPAASNIGYALQIFVGEDQGRSQEFFLPGLPNSYI